MGGEWTGHYVDPNSVREKAGHVFPVTATLVETNGRVDGTMTDLEPAYEVPYKRYINYLPEKEWAKAELFARRFTNVTVRLSLPERSRISGSVSGDRIELTKRYDGSQTIVWLSEGKEIAKETVPNHEVLYRGAFDQGGEVVDGEWCVRRKGLLGVFGKVDGEGSFHLVRRTG